MEKMDKEGLDLKQVNIENLKKLFPECVTDGKVDFELLKAFLGEEVNTSSEKYCLSWVGKNEAIKISQSPSTGTLIPCKEKSLNWDKTENIYIEGDNLEVLKTLCKTYYGKIKMIYIDPPYNTGSDFVYHDNYQDNIGNYLNISGQNYKTNPETSGRYHTAWLNMIYPRLSIAKNLLTEDGGILVSIDDNEVDNLRKVMDEIFGKENFVCCFVWQKAFAPKNDNKWISTSHEYIVLYAKSKLDYKRNLLPRTNTDGYSNPDNDPRGLWASGTALAISFSETGVYELVAPNGKRHMPPAGRCWRYSKETFDKLISENRMWFGKDGNGVPRVKRFLSEMPDGVVPQSLLKYEEVGSGQDGTQSLKSIFDNTLIFDYPKPVELIKRLLTICSDKDSYVLDFFSGSATTAHSILDLNAEDGGHRKFILVQLPELCEEKSIQKKSGYNTICDIGEERIRRVSKKIYEEAKKKYDEAGLLQGDTVNPDDLDLGFKVFKLDSTNIRPWDPTEKFDEQSLYFLNDVIKEGRTQLDIAFEVMLKYGVFNMPLKEIVVNGKNVFSVGDNYMIISLNDDIAEDDVLAIAKLEPKAVVFMEKGFRDDNAKINAEYTFKRMGIDNVKCI